MVALYLRSGRADKRIVIDLAQVKSLEYLVLKKSDNHVSIKVKMVMRARHQECVILIQLTSSSTFCLLAFLDLMSTGEDMLESRMRPFITFWLSSFSFWLLSLDDYCSAELGSLSKTITTRWKSFSLWQ